MGLGRIQTAQVLGSSDKVAAKVSRQSPVILVPTFLVVRGGVEPPTFRFSGGRSYRLSYLTLVRHRLRIGARGAGREPSGPDGI